MSDATSSFCSQCGSPLKEGTRFCTKCGTPVESGCPSCGRPVEHDALFCGYCGTDLVALTTSTTAPAPRAVARPGAERRLVSVLFADLVGFTSHAEGRDPEEVRDLLSEYFERASDVIGLYGGVIEKFIGDAVMAVWGTPTAQEDDAERAVRAALELVDAVVGLGRKRGIPLQARAGVHTGEAAVTIGAQGQGMVAGDTVNTASRLQSVAEPGSVLVDRASYLGARDAIAFKEAGPVELKGKDEAVESWVALRVVGGRGGTRAHDAMEPPFTGRGEELRQLKDLLHATSREGKARLASVVGIAGIGKSRLIWELYKHVDGLDEDIWWHEGRSPAYGDGVAFWALAEMVRMRTEIAETDETAVAEQKLDACLDSFFSDAEERAWLKPALRHLIGLDESDEPSEKLFAAWRRFFEGIAEVGSVAMIFEDLHWADPGLIDFIEQLVEWARSSPILIVTLSRPELRDKRPTWGAGARSFSSVHLDPLGDEDMVLLLKGIVPDLPTAMADEVISRAEGVPLYAVEMIRMLIDRKDLEPVEDGFRWVGSDESLEVPDSLHSLIASRLDALPGADRLLAQDASVLGKTFTLASLAAVSEIAEDELGRRLHELVGREILVLDADPRSPERGQYGFVQSLIREIAYQTLSMSDRKVRHLKAARHFETLDESDLAEVVATHYLEAYNNSPKDENAEGLADAARASLVLAAERAGSLGSHQQSWALLEKALGFTTVPLERGRLLHMAGAAAISSGAIERATEMLREAVDLLDHDPDRTNIARARASLAQALFLASRVEEAIPVLQRGIDELEDPVKDPAAATLYVEIARMHTFAGHAEETARFCDLAMIPAERSGDLEVVAQALITRGVLALLAGRPHEADALLAGGAKLAEENGFVGTLMRAHTNMSSNQLNIHPALALESAERGVVHGRRYGLRDGVAFVITNLIPAAVEMGRLDYARDLVNEAFENEVTDDLRYLITPEIARLEAMAGNIEKAHGYLEEFHKHVGNSTSRQDHALLAECEMTIALIEFDFSALHSYFDQLPPSDIPEATAIVPTLARAGVWGRDAATVKRSLELLADYYSPNQLTKARAATIEAGLVAIEDRREEAIERFRAALAEWDRLDIPLQLALCRMDFALSVGGEEAAEAREAAIAFFEGVGNEILVERLRAGA